MIITYAMFQRKFARESQEAKQYTFKRFREWLNETFVSGIPSDEEWQHNISYNGGRWGKQLCSVYQERCDSHTSNDSTNGVSYFGDEDSEENRDIGERYAVSYNPEMHVFKKKAQVLYI